MTNMKSVVVLGAGALGAAYASRFYDMDSSCISLAASGERYKRLKSEGLVVNNQRYEIPVLSRDDISPPADLIIVALKHHHLAEALPELQNRVGENTTILSVMNGLDSEDIIGAMYGDDKVIYSTVVGIVAQRTRNTINYSRGGTIFVGEADNTILTDRVRAIQALFDHAGIDHQTPDDMIRIMWWKFMINVGINQASALLSAPYGVFQKSKHAQQIMESAMREVLIVANAAGVNLVEKDIQEWYSFMNTLDPRGKTSMLQDIEAGRRTEVDIFAGKMIELGKIYSIPTPINEVLFHAIKVLEQDVRRNA